MGSAVVGTFARVVGIGAGSGRRHQSAEAMGWAQGLARPGLPEVRDMMALTVPPVALLPGVVTGGMLSVAAASGSRYEAARRARAQPDAVAEEMEAFAVALAARLAGVPLTMIRGISNVAGDRDKGRWRSAEALRAARGVLEHLLTAQR